MTSRTGESALLALVKLDRDDVIGQTTRVARGGLAMALKRLLASNDGRVAPVARALGVDPHSVRALAVVLGVEIESVPGNPACVEGVQPKWLRKRP